MSGRIADAYRRTRKPHDILWNRFVARPLAAVLLVPLASSPITPNQVTLLSLLVFGGAMAVLVAVPTYAGLIAAALIIELSYVLDCVDGQLARWRGTSTPVGAHLDFLMDELKAFLLVAGTGARLYRVGNRDARWLLEALAGLVIVACALALTTFVRRPEYAAATGARVAGTGDYGNGLGAGEAGGATPAPPPRRGPLALVLSLAQLIAHYPSTIVFVAAANRLDWFLHAYLGVHAVYAARTLLAITLRLGRPQRA